MLVQSDIMVAYHALVWEDVGLVTQPDPSFSIMIIMIGFVTVIHSGAALTVWAFVRNVKTIFSCIRQHMIAYVVRMDVLHV